MKAAGLAVALLVAATAAAAAPPPEVAFALKPADRPSPPGNLRWARLEVTNNSSQALTQAEVRWAEGGPLYRLPLAVAPQATGQAELLVPAAWAQQRYDVALRAGPRQIAGGSAVLSWPEAALPDEPFPDDLAFRPYEADLLLWPGALKRSLFAAAALAFLAAAGSTLVRRRWLRMVLLTATAAGLGLFFALRAGREPTVFVRSGVYEGWTGVQRPITVVTARRSGTWRSDAWQRIPLYASFGQVRDDRTTIDWGRAIETPLDPSRVRIFQDWTAAPAPRPD